MSGAKAALNTNSMKARLEIFKIGGQRKANVLLFDFGLFQVCVSFRSQMIDQLFNEVFGCGSAGSDRDSIHTFQGFGPDLTTIVEQVGGHSSLLTDFNQTAGI